MDYKYQYFKYKQKYLLLKGGDKSLNNQHFKIKKCFPIDELKEKIINKLRNLDCVFLEEHHNIMKFTYNQEFNFSITINQTDKEFEIFYNTSNKDNKKNIIILLNIKYICNKIISESSIKKLRNFGNDFLELKEINEKKEEHEEIDLPMEINIYEDLKREIMAYINKENYTKDDIIEIIKFIQKIIDMRINKMNGGGRHSVRGSIIIQLLISLLDKLLRFNSDDYLNEIIIFYKNFIENNRQNIIINILQSGEDLERIKEINKKLNEHIKFDISQNHNFSIERISSDIIVLQEFILSIQEIYNTSHEINTETYNELIRLLKIINAVRFEVSIDKYYVNILTFYFNAFLNKILEYKNHIKNNNKEPNDNDNPENNIENKQVETTNNIDNPENEDTNEIKLNFNPMNRTVNDFGKQNTQHKLNKTTKT